MKNKKIIRIIIVIVVVLAIAGATTAAITLSPIKGKENLEFWTHTMEYDIADTVQIVKQTDKDFIILNLTDIQYNDFLDVGKRKFTKTTINKVIDEVKPDLITLTGDQIWANFNKYSLKELVKFIDSFGIQWAPVMGNHDADGNTDKQWVGDMYEKATYSVFKKGPNNIGGIGNYVINIMEDGLIHQSLIMMDSGSSRSYKTLKERDKIVSYALDENFELKKDEENNYIDYNVGYDYEFISPSQISWYKWCIIGAETYNLNKGGQKPESILFIHIPLPEYYLAYVDYLLNDKDESYQFFGAMREDVCSAKVNSGMFDAILEMKSTKNVIAGHDHVNDYSLLYHGVRLTYAVKTGDRCYFSEDANGGTVITLGETTTIAHKYIKP